MKNLPSLCCALLLAGCNAPPNVAVPPPTTPGVPYTLTAAQTKALQSSISAQLKDPESARFSVTKATKGPSGLVMACGLVNAKNSLGGYVGAQPYIAGITTSGRVVPIAVGGTKEAQDATSQQCAMEGMPL